MTLHSWYFQNTNDMYVSMKTIWTEGKCMRKLMYHFEEWFSQGISNATGKYQPTSWEKETTVDETIGIKCLRPRTEEM